MATDPHRKHHRSPSIDDQSPDTPKRHKHHRHRRHHHRHHHKKDETLSPENKHKEAVVVEDIATKKLVDYDDMEEGEIVEDDEGRDGGNLVLNEENKAGGGGGGDSDVESGEFKAVDGPNTGFDDSYMSVDVGTDKKSTGYLKSPGSDRSDEIKDGARQSHNDESPVLERIANGDHDSRSSKRESRSHSRHKSLEKESGKGKERHRDTSKKLVLDLMDMDNDDDAIRGDKRNSHSKKVGDSPSRAANYVKTASDTIMSESPDRRRERSQSILHDRHLKARHLHERDERLYDNGKVGYEVDDGRDNRSGKYYRADSAENGRVKGTERGSNYHMSYSRGGKYEDDSWDQGPQEKVYRDKKRVDREVSKERSERDLDRDSEKGLHSYRSRDLEREKDSVRERERFRGNKSDIDRGRNRDGSRDRDLDRERDRRREKDRGRSRDRDFDRERRDGSVSLYGDKDREWDRTRDRSRRQEMDIGRDKYSDRDRHRDKDRDSVDYRSRRYHKYDDHEDGYGNRDRRCNYEEADRRTKHDPEKHESAKADSHKKKEDGDRNDDDDQNNYQETLELKLVEQEEEDVDKIKEESRRRREAILQKYKAKQSQQQEQQQDVSVVPKVSDEQLTEQPSQNLVSATSSREERNGVKNNEKSSLVNGSVGAERNTVVLGEGSPKSEKSNDMFCDDMFGDDMFGESPTGVRKAGKGDGVALERSGLHDNWDDPEGYYSFRLGEILDSRYEIAAAHGKGVFSTVVRAKDLKAGTGDADEVAIKIIRNNETMLKAGTEELVILKKLVGADPEDRRHCVRYLSHFKYRNHLCIVFESLHMNLREVLKKFGRNIGLKLTAVRTYAKQLFIALKHLRNCGVLHCDIKPDNMLVNDSKNVLKLCDFGNAMFAGKNEITPYLVSRFYRAPEIILGLSYDHPMDIWSVGCCLYELYTGKVLFPGPSNNDMLRLHMELKGPFPKKMLRKGAFIEQHFDPDLNFLAVEEDPVTKKAIRRLLVNIRPKDIGNIIKGAAGEDPKMLANFKDLLDKIFVLDPDKRLTVSQALNHPFITGK